MSENIEPTGENYNPPTLPVIEERMTELGERGVPVELECFECGDSVDHRVLPEERDSDKPLRKTLCRSCMVKHFQSKDLL
ncbi:hypothetical protein [Haloterrigena salifodinae]|uniref:hypothetical protein n=1 Tax=Haloterrigena salifodinae TaxID=2675099 RepID=UPI000F89BB3E|nr:hypothetical protein [Haloterrigena salifodinae]